MVKLHFGNVGKDSIKRQRKKDSNKNNRIGFDAKSTFRYINTYEPFVHDSDSSKIYLEVELMRLKNSARVCLSSLKEPSTELVTVLEPAFSTPRITMHMWLNEQGRGRGGENW